ncbi:putative phytosulfokine [Rosa chinensis]|uniref:Phytosulfokine n=1 Tax=Rosa chinensis TaxID=74649 RepID=A0A2P6RBJ2_ROSCH|nr:putative phytosulfokine [Rosa chinensis]
MKKQSLLLVIFSLFLFLVISSHARHLPHDQGSSTAAADHGIMDLMGSEECHEKDEECLQRRMIAEAHLDYIYTQHQKP